MPCAAGEVVRVEVGLRVEREEAARPHVDDHRGACGVRAHRALDRLLELDVDREAQVAPGDGIHARRGVDQVLRLGARAIATPRVDHSLLPAALSAQIGLPGALDAGRADRVARLVVERVLALLLVAREVLVSLGPVLRERLRVDLRDVPEHVRAQVLVRIEANRDADDVDARELVVVLLELGHDVARHVLANEDRRVPAGRLVVVAGACRVDARLEGPLLLGIQPQDLGEAGPRVGVVRDRLAVAIAHRPRARHHAPGHDLDVVRGPARREDLSVGVADDAAGRREDDPADDVLVRDGRVRRPVERLELEEPPDDDHEGEEGGERHPLVALAELADVRAREQEVAHGIAPLGSPRVGLPVATCTAWAMRKTMGATAAVAIACGSVNG